MPIRRKLRDSVEPKAFDKVSPFYTNISNALAKPEYADTVTLGPSQTADIAFTANNPGQWMFHCHILDHIENPSPAGEGSASQMADGGRLMTFINVS